MNIKKVVSFISAIVLALGVSVNTYAFSDMPEGEMGKAMQNAVDNGLIEGIDDNTIAPDMNITRAQMATIITRAFRATEKSENVFNDVNSGAWYADAVSKANYMGAFEGDDNNNFNPESNITFQETYLVLSRVFGFEGYKVDNSFVTVNGVSDEVLNDFPDKDKLAPWAWDGAKYIVGNGNWTGIDGKLKPTDYITRGEFAILMDSIVDVYIDKAGEYKDLGDKMVVVRCGGVVIDGLRTNRGLILTYGIDDYGVEVKNSIVNGALMVLGGIDKTPTEEMVDGKKQLLADDAHIKLSGKFYDVRVKTPMVYVDASNAEVQYFKGVEGSRVALNLTIQ